MSNPTDPPPPGGALGELVSSFAPRRSTGLKLILVCALALVMAIPAGFVYSVAWERAERADEAVREVSRRVGGQQSVLGPVLVVPYSRIVDEDDEDTKIYGHAVAYAETGRAEAEVSVERKKRGLYQIPVFTADFAMRASFDPAALRQAVPPDATPFWADARLYVGISDNRGVAGPFRVRANGGEIAMEPAPRWTSDPAVYSPTPPSGVNLARGVIPGLAEMERLLEVSVSLRLTGADRLALGPFAKTTAFSMTSEWESPSFVGGVTPALHTASEPDTPGFEASWSVPYLARNIPGAGGYLNLSDVTRRDHRDMAVRFIDEASPYQSVQRALKYAVMFIGFVFLAYFLFELASGARAHPAQYLLVGLAQTIFYLLLLAMAERVGFDIAFLAAAGMTIALTSAYAGSVFDSARYALGSAAALSAIYGLSYLLMRAEDFALLGGAFASFGALALTMWMTRNVDWYGRTARQPA